MREEDPNHHVIVLQLSGMRNISTVLRVEVNSWYTIDVSLLGT